MDVENVKIYLIKFGYEKIDAIKIASYLKANYNEKKISINSIKQINTFLKNLNYSHEEILKIGKNFPTIYSYNFLLLNKKIDDIVSLGHPRYEIINLIKKYPQILNYSLKSMNEKNKNLSKLGYEKSDILKMTRNYPLIYKYSTNNIEKNF